MNFLITGGAGYIGSHAVKALREKYDEHRVAVLDSLDRGHRQAVPIDTPFYQLDLSETDAVAELLKRERIDCVMNFAALAYVGESVNQPLRYYHNNTAGTLSLLRAMDAVGVRRLVHSSTCATYGKPAPHHIPLSEDMPQNPINPYGWSKLFTERILRDHAATRKDFAFAAPRYFNVAGSAADGTIGEHHEPETHLIPLLLLTALGRRREFTIYGDDYDTSDGTCIRDYIHVEDLVEAHLTMAEALTDGDQFFYNLGIGKGYSVREMVESAKRVTGINFPVKIGSQRPGDPPTLFANADRARRDLDWQARWTDIDAIIETAWRWFRNHPKGYGKG